MSKSGWLAPDDLVWQSGMADWTPAREVEGLYSSSLATKLRKTIDGLRAPTVPATEESRQTTPPGIPENRPQRVRLAKRESPKVPSVDWNDLHPRHVLAACGGFLAALGIAFTAIAQSRLALVFTLRGIVIAMVGLSVEIAGLIGQAIENIGKASKEAAERRLRANELAVEKQGLDLEAARLAQGQAAREA